MADTVPIRASEELPLERLAGWLAGRIEGAEQGITAEQFPGGHSNLTYLLRIAGREYVLRRAPNGPVPLKAHDMVREFRILEAVHPYFALAPRAYVLCEDAALLGVPFYLMERRKGLILRSRVPAEFADVRDFPVRVSRAVVDCLAALHSIDVRTHGLLAYGKPEGFLERQVRGWSERWRGACLDPNAEMDEVLRALAAAIPLSGEPTVVHNDFKMDNLMFAPEDPGRITAVLDWEMTTIGDPLADLGLSLCYWLHADPQVSGRPRIEGWYTRAQFLERYGAATGRDLSAVGWHEVLGVAKLAVILQQIYVRYVKGQTRDPRFEVLGSQVRDLILTAFRLKETYGI